MNSEVIRLAARGDEPGVRAHVAQRRAVEPHLVPHLEGGVHRARLIRWAGYRCAFPKLWGRDSRPFD